MLGIVFGFHTCAIFINCKALKCTVRMKQIEKLHAEDTVVVCTHGGCMVVLEAALTGT
jgi:hypothetical protein